MGQLVCLSVAQITYTEDCELVVRLQTGRVGQDHANTDFADSALLLPLNLYGEKRRPFCWANKTCQALADNQPAILCIRIEAI